MSEHLAGLLVVPIFTVILCGTFLFLLWCYGAPARHERQRRGKEQAELIRRLRAEPSRVKR